MAYGYLYNAGGWTVELWFWRDAPPVSGHACLFSQYTQLSGIIWTQGAEIGRQIWFGFIPTTGAFHLSLGDEGGGNSLQWTDPSPSGYEGDSSWHHVALSLDGATRKIVKLYLDGELYATPGTLATSLVWNAGILNVAGAMHSHHGIRGHFAYDKRLAYFAAFNKELTANRIQEHYTAGNGGTVYYGESEVQRLERIYGWAGIPTQARMNEPATTTLQGIQVAGSNALTQAQDTVASAGGYIFADGQGTLQYHNRTHRYNKLAKMVLSESSQSAPEVGITFTTNHEYIYNDIHGDRPFGSRVRLMNQVSHDTYGHKVHEFTLKVTDPDELTNAVTWVLARYGEDRVRVKGVTFECTTSHKLKELAYGRVEVGDKLTLDELPEMSPYPTMDFIIESIAVTANFLDKTWIVDMELSPDDVNQVFQIGKSALGGSDYVAF